MDAAEKKLFDLFSEKEDLASREPDIAAAFGASAQALDEGRRKVSALHADAPDLALDSSERAALGGERFPELQGVMGLLARGLSRHPTLTTQIQAQPPLFLRTAALDRALGRMIWAGQLCWRGGETGELLSGAALRGLCRGILQQAERAQADPSRPEPQRSAVRTMFTEARRLEEERRAREARAQSTAAAAEAPLRAEISEAEESAAMARVMETFLQEVRRRS